MTWTAERVSEAFAAWLWVPEGAEVHEVPGGRVVLYPAYVGHRVQVVAEPPAGAEQAVLDRALALAAEHDQDAAYWHVPGEPGAEAVVALLRARGATVEETVDRLALVLADRRRPDTGLPDGYVVRRVVDEAGARAASHVDEVVFDLPALTAERLPALLAELAQEDAERSGARFVVLRGNEPVASAGMAVVDGVVRMYGGATVPEHRRRGLYGALLDARLDLAAEWGAGLALVKGRVDTSAPILRRRGFAEHGREVTYRVSPPAP